MSMTNPVNNLFLKEFKGIWVKSFESDETVENTND